MNTISPVNNTPSFGMALDRKCAQFITDTANSLREEVNQRPYKGGLKEVFARIGDNVKYSKANGLEKRRDEINRISNTCRRDIAIDVTKKGQPIFQIYSIDDGTVTKTLGINANKKKSLGSNVKNMLDNLLTYFERMDNNQKAADAKARKVTKTKVLTAKHEANASRSYQLRSAKSSAASEAGARSDRYGQGS